MKVLVFKPNEESFTANIKNELRALQETVGGYIETVKIDKDTTLICNEEGKLKGFEANRIINGDLIVGTFLLCGIKGPEFCSLTEEQISKYKNL